MGLNTGKFILLAIIITLSLSWGCSSDDNGDIEPSAYSQLGATINSVKFYEGDRHDVPLESRKYDNFRYSTARIIFYELHLTYPAPGKEVPFTLEVVFHRPDGSELGRMTSGFNIPSDWTGSYHTAGYGWDSPGKWLPGEYTVKFYDKQNNNLITSGSFTVIDDTGADIVIPGIRDYYPTYGPVGSQVAILFNDSVLLDMTPYLKAFYNNTEIPITGIASDSLQVSIPPDAVSGNIQIKAGNSVSNPVYFTVEQSTATPLISEILQPSSDFSTINYQDEISVTVPPNFLNRSRQVSIAAVSHPPANDINPLGHSRIYDVSLDGLTQLNEFIKISIKYDPSLLNPAYSAEEQLAGMRWDEAGQFWLTLPYQVDQDHNLIHIYTDHLSLMGWAIFTGVSTAASWAGEKLLNDVYVTPEGNFRILYSRKDMDNDPFFVGRNWDHYGPDIFTIQYNSKYPKYIQDMGKLFEIALDNFRQAGFKDPIVKPGRIWGEWRTPITVKIESWWSKSVGLGVSDPQYEKIWQNIHLPMVEFKQFRSPFGSYAVIGHELFHRMQAEYYGRTGFLRSANHWWIEATAEYAGSRAAWNTKYDYHERDIPADFLKYPITTKGFPAHHWGQKYYEYAASVFIRFLVEEKQLNFKDLVEHIAGGEPLAKLNEFISSRSIFTLRDYYADFAAWSMFTEKSFLRPYKIADFSYAATTSDEIADKKDQLTLTGGDSLKVEVSGGLAPVQVFYLPENKRLSSTPNPLTTLRSGDEWLFDDFKKNHVLYFMAVNSAQNSNSVSLNLKIIKPDNSLKNAASYSFSLQGPYSARLWAVKTNQDVTLTITPDEITDGKAEQPYTFSLKAENIPDEVRRVHFVWDFGDLQNHSKGNSDGIWTSDGKAALDVTHSFARGKSECEIKVAVHDNFTDEKLAEAAAKIIFYTITIEGARHIIYELKGGASEVTHEFEARFSPTGTYSFLWEFGDGQTNGLSHTQPSGRVSINHTYTGLKDGDKFYPSVKLMDQRGNTLAQDQITITISDDNGDDDPAPDLHCGWGADIDYSKLRKFETSTALYYRDDNGKYHGSFLAWHDSTRSQLRYVRCYYEGEYHGRHTWWYKNGLKFKEEDYQHGVQHGKAFLWYENGTLQADYNYQNGKSHGLCKQWFEDGQLRHQGNYQDGKGHGLIENWHSNGNQSEKANYREGLLHGSYTSWHSNGNKMSVGSYENGHRIGIWYHYRDDGSCQYIYNANTGETKLGC